MKKEQLSQIGLVIQNYINDYNFYTRRKEEDMQIAYASKLETSNDILFCLGYRQKILYTRDQWAEETVIDKVIIRLGNRTMLTIESEE